MAIAGDVGVSRLVLLILDFELPVSGPVQAVHSFPPLWVRRFYHFPRFSPLFSPLVFPPILPSLNPSLLAFCICMSYGFPLSPSLSPSNPYFLFVNNFWSFIHLDQITTRPPQPTFSGTSKSDSSHPIRIILHSPLLDRPELVASEQVSHQFLANAYIAACLIGMHTIWVRVQPKSFKCSDGSLKIMCLK